MGVSMEEAVEEELIEHDRGEGVRDVGGVDAGLAKARVIRDLDRGDVLKREHLPRGALPHHGGDSHARLVGEVGREALGVDPLVEIVDLLEAGLRELLDQGGHVDAAIDEPHAAQPPAHLPQRGEVDVHDVADPRALHLDHHVRKAGLGGVVLSQARPVCLAQRRGGHRDLIDRRVDLLERHAQLGLRERADRIEGHGRDLVLQVLELLGDLRRQHVESRGHELAELDHQPAQVHGEVAEAAREGLHPSVARALRDARQADARQHDLVPPRHREVPGGKTQDAAVAGATVGDVGHRSSLPPPDLIDWRHS
ncbi:hypothetical protein GCM10025873_22360 [Demequina sediminis]|nr:hypothetical protein GCM10025873_22360 [Demequina sediminis]